MYGFQVGAFTLSTFAIRAKFAALRADPRIVTNLISRPWTAVSVFDTGALPLAVDGSANELGNTVCMKEEEEKGA